METEQTPLEVGWRMGLQFSEFMNRLRTLGDNLQNGREDIRYWSEVASKLTGTKQDYELMMSRIERISDTVPEFISGHLEALENRLNGVRGRTILAEKRSVYLGSFFRDNPEVGEFYGVQCECEASQ